MARVNTSIIVNVQAYRVLIVELDSSDMNRSLRSIKYLVAKDTFCKAESQVRIASLRRQVSKATKKRNCPKQPLLGNG